MDSVELSESEKSPSPNQRCTGALALAAEDSEEKNQTINVFSSLTVASEEERNR
jgi:hypothetical protein